MNTFKRKALSCAILGGLAVASGAAQAVYEDPNGLGSALVYPYYTVQGGYNTYMSVVNTTTRAKVLKVRFREGKNSREVLDFNLYLSPNDVWTAALGAADATATSGAILVTGDNSCTVPPIPAGGAPFRNFQYVGSNLDAGPTTLDRTREGYFEIIEMATLNGAAAAAVTHTTAGVPANCGFVQPPGFNVTSATAAGYFSPPNGGLTGTYQLINVPAGLNFGGNATALAQFSSTVIYQDIGNDNVNLSNANPTVAVTVANNPLGASGPGTEVYFATYANGQDAVSATMMHSSVINEYSLDAATKSATDWVMTFPTKQFYLRQTPPTTPFTNSFTASGACEAISLSIFNREEQQPTSGGAQPFSPLPPGVAGPALCWEAQVISFLNQPATLSASSVLASQNFNTIATGFQNGWAQIGFIGTNATGTGLQSSTGTGTVTNINTGITQTGQTVKFVGLPVIGFAARTLNNGSALSCATSTGATATCAGAYGVALDHKYTVNVTPAP